MGDTGLRILYIEDDPASRRLLAQMLRYGGYEVLLADRGLAGIDMARREQPDLILTDIDLPDINGQALTTLLRREPRFRQTPIVALTGQSAARAETALAAGMTGFLTKPIEMARLLDRLRFYLDGGHDRIDTQTMLAAQQQYTQDVVQNLEQRVRLLERNNETLRRLDGMKQSFIQITAHELRTPLTVIAGYTRMLDMHAPLKTLRQSDAVVDELLHALDDAVGRFQSVIDDVVVMSRIITDRVALSLAPTNLADLVQAAVEDLRPALKERSLRLDVTPSQWPHRLMADPRLLRLVLDNLLSNAIKYTPDGGSIRLEAEADAQRVRFRVMDTGVGVAPEDLPRVFEPFVTVGAVDRHSSSKTAYLGGGLGLGLAVAQGILEAHGGSIRLHSDGHDPAACPGTTAIINLPLDARRTAKPTDEHE